MSQEDAQFTLPPESKPTRSKRSFLKIMSIGCLSIVVCMLIGGTILVFSGVLSGPPGKRNDYPTWSPDGNRILFQSDRNGNNDIYLMDADGSHITQLTKDLFASIYLLQSASDEEPDWSPDGSHIAFTSGRDNTMMNYVDTNIYVMDADGSNVKQLTGVGHEDAGPDWSPNGKQIAYVSKDTFTSEGNLIENPTWNIYLINVDGSNEIQLTNDSANELEVAWSPDGAHIAFISDRNDHDFDIYVMNADGSNIVRLTGK
jgi:Tol biopolymer transport system component